VTVSHAPDILASLGLDHLIPAAPFVRDTQGRFADPLSSRVVFAPAAALAGLHHVIEHERAGAWAATMKTCGLACGLESAKNLDAQLARAGKPALAALPLEACLALLERLFAVQGWGRLGLELAYADQGVLIAHLEKSPFVETLPEAEHFTDAMIAAVLRGFFEYLTGQTLDAEEIGCARRGAARCSFVITAPEKLATVAGRIGHDDADTIIARLVGAPR